MEGFCCRGDEVVSDESVGRRCFPFFRGMKFTPRVFFLRQGGSQIRYESPSKTGDLQICWRVMCYLGPGLSMESSVLVRYSFLTFSDFPYSLIWGSFPLGRFLGDSSSGFSVMMEESHFPMGIGGHG